MAMNRFWSALLRSATVSRWAARAAASIWRNNAAPALVSRQICARRSRWWIERSIKLRDCNRLSAPVVVVRSSATSSAKVVWSAVRQGREKAVLQRRNLESCASLLKKRDVNLVQPPDQKSRPLVERPGIAALLRWLLGHHQPLCPCPSCTNLMQSMARLLLYSNTKHTSQLSWL